MAIAAALKPPRTSAPSPPITTMPRRAGIATQSAVNISGPALTSVFVHENGVPKPPTQRRVKNATGRFAEDERKIEKRPPRQGAR